MIRSLAAAGERQVAARRCASAGQWGAHRRCGRRSAEGVGDETREQRFGIRVDAMAGEPVAHVDAVAMEEIEALRCRWPARGAEPGRPRPTSGRAPRTRRTTTGRRRPRARTRCAWPSPDPRGPGLRAAFGWCDGRPGGPALVLAGLDIGERKGCVERLEGISHGGCSGRGRPRGGQERAASVGRRAEEEGTTNAVFMSHSSRRNSPGGPGTRRAYPSSCAASSLGRSVGCRGRLIGCRLRHPVIVEL
jgi:hypothetical protein